MIGNVGENVPQIGFGIDVVELGGADQRVDGSSAPLTLVGTNEETVLACGRRREAG